VYGRVLLLLAMIMTAAAANVRLYLKDGTYHVVREYKVVEDRVRYYSVERSEWEEIPLELADLKRTEAEIREKAQTREEETKAIEAEEKAEREAAREAARVPDAEGVYYVAGPGQLKPIPLAECKVATSKSRSVLKVITPIPIVAGKATVEIDGLQSANLVSNDLPEFYIRLASAERFGMLKLTPAKKSRIVEKWNLMPVTNEIIEEHEEVEVFRKQVGDLLYKIWPKEALSPGEYAVVEYTAGKANIQVWDFKYQSGTK